MFNLDADFSAFDSFSDDLEFNLDQLREEFEPETNMAAQFPQLADHLWQKGAVLVRLEYIGRDGEGRFLSLRCFEAAYQELETPISASLVEELREFCALKLEAAHPTWTAEHGSCGDFGWDLQKNTFTHIHRPYEREAFWSYC